MSDPTAHHTMGLAAEPSQTELAAAVRACSEHPDLWRKLKLAGCTLSDLARSLAKNGDAHAAARTLLAR